MQNDIMSYKEFLMILYYFRQLMTSILTNTLWACTIIKRNRLSPW